MLQFEELRLELNDNKQKLSELREADMEVVELSESQKQSFRDLLDDTYQLVKDSMEHPEFMDEILK